MRRARGRRRSRLKPKNQARYAASAVIQHREHARIPGFCRGNSDFRPRNPSITYWISRFLCGKVLHFRLCAAYGAAARIRRIPMATQMTKSQLIQQIADSSELAKKD